ncbi:CRIB domain-containing protein RIC7-like [Benincasa hispida]|uniref:CRIB domain-containing protein RIC7-like n=1 Tax=Benincasa hispida TaxID=102211 RepID=UPI0019019246|nr:CRIB domain-containing protein RIC7-like [Benincasa hispida]XP_038888499.1 CRIB domain-containing protein RIC7-like [Benincasa hispida]
MSNNKMKGLLKGLRYISQIFDNEKEPEMQIGFPTDVKHVAHIGWDGPSVNSPSWMNEFKAPPGISSAPHQEDASGQWASQDSKRDMAVTTRDLPELPKSSRRQSSTVGGSVGESPTTREKSEKTKSKKSSKSKESSSSDSRRSSDLNQGSESPTQSLPGVPKKARRKKSKEEGSTRSRSKTTAGETCSSQISDNGSDAGSVAGSISRSNDDDLLTGDGVFT